MRGADRYGWNEKAQRFFDRQTGRYVSRDFVRAAFDDVIAAESRAAQVISDALRSGKVDLGEWQAEMRRIIKDGQLQAAALARGGWDQMRAADYGRVGAAVREQYAFLDRFTQEIRKGLPLDGRFLMRAGMYAQAARPFFHEQQGAALEAAGYSEERNILHPAEHCQVCLDQSAAGYVPIGTLIPIGQRQCMGNDKCTMRYR
jgi:hypothetical protein